MSHFIEYSKFYDQPILLTKAEIVNPYMVLDQFCADYRLNELRHYIAEIVYVCLTTENTQFSDPEDRANLITQFNNFERVFEAVQLILKMDTTKEDAVGLV